jgi:hypothetical protein
VTDDPIGRKQLDCTVPKRGASIVSAQHVTQPVMVMQRQHGQVPKRITEASVSEVDQTLDRVVVDQEVVGLTITVEEPAS